MRVLIVDMLTFNFETVTKSIIECVILVVAWSDGTVAPAM